MDLESIYSTLLRQKWTILLTCLIVVGAVSAYTFLRTPVYQASAMVQLEGSGEEEGTEILQNAALGGSPNLLSEVGVLRNSFELARRVAETVRDTVQAEGTTRASFPVFIDSETEELVSTKQAAHRIMEKVTFTPESERDMIKITTESEEPREAAVISNAYAEAYRKRSREQARASVRAARKFLEEQAEEQQKEIQKLEEEWKSFAKDNRLIAEGMEGERVVTRYDELMKQRDELQFELENQQTQLELLRRRLREIQPQLESNVLEQQEESGLQTEIGALEKKIADLRAQAAEYYATNPDLKGDTTRIRNQFPELAKLIERIEGLEKRKQELARQLVERASDGEGSGGTEAPLDRVVELRRQIAEKELQVNQLRAQVSALDSELQQYEGQLGDIPEQRVERDRLERRLDQAKSFHQMIVEELQKTTIAEESKLGHVEIVRSAFVPTFPDRPNTQLNLILGVLLGIGFGVGFAFFREAVNNRLRQPEDIEESGHTLLGVVPRMDEEIDRVFDGHDTIELEGRQISTRLMPLLNPWSSVTENYRLIQTNLKSLGTQASNVFFVTSAQQGEGKTITTSNLALTAALSGKRVLLVDADMRKPSAHRVLGMPRTPGLADILEKMPPEHQLDGSPDTRNSGQGTDGSSSFWSTYWTNRTAVDGLHFLPAGVAEEAPTKTFDSERIRRLVEATQQHFDMVFIDTPPLQAASDAVVIGAQTNAAGIVVSADGTDSRALDSVMRSLSTAGATVAGVVLNQFDERKAGAGSRFSYSYYTLEDYYEYQNGSYAEQEA